MARPLIPETLFGEMLIFEKSGGAGLPVEATLTLTNAVRNALMGNAGKQGPLPEVLHGHSEGTHCAIVALPFAGTPHPDGHLLGFALVMPRKIRTEDKRAVLSTCGTLRTIHLPPPLTGWNVEPLIEPSVRIGLPEEVKIEPGPYSRLSGIPPVPQFRLHRKPGERAKWAVHATLTFEQPVRGPVLLGAGRFFGLGLLKPDDRLEGENRDRR